MALHWTLSKSPCFPCTEEPSTEPSISGMSHQCWVEGKDHVPWHADSTLPKAVLMNELDEMNPIWCNEVNPIKTERATNLKMYPVSSSSL